MSSYQALVNEIQRLCQAQKTGTLLVAADNNAAKVVIQQGQIIALTYHVTCGQAALSRFRSITTINGTSFWAGSLQAAPDADLPSTQALLAELAGSTPTATPAVKTPNAVADAKVADPATLRAVLNDEVAAILGPVAGFVINKYAAQIAAVDSAQAVNDAVLAIAGEMPDETAAAQLVSRVTVRLR